MPVKWGVIGAGGIADRRTIPEGITKADNATLVAVMDVDPARAEAAGRKYNVPFFTSEEQLLAAGVDAVYIATPTYLHCKQVLQAAAAGKHVLCEKPMAMSVEEAERMAAACKKAGVKLGLGYMMRFFAQHQEAAKIVAEGRLGKPVMARAQLSCWYPKMDGAWRQIAEMGGGGSLIDMGSHCIDLLEMIFASKVTEVSCFAGNLVQGYDTEDTAVMTVRFGNGAIGMVDASFAVPDASSRNRLEIYGSKGCILAEGTLGQSELGQMTAILEEGDKGYEAQQLRAAGGGFEIKPAPVNGYRAEIEGFSKAIETNTEPPIGAADGLWNLKIMLAAYESAKTGQVVKIK